MYSDRAKFRDTDGILTIDDQGLRFSRFDGFFVKKETLVITIPIDAIVSVQIEGLLSKVLAVSLDKEKVHGFSKQIFKVSELEKWVKIIDETIRNHRFHYNNATSSISKEIEQLKRRTEEGLITSDEYERAKEIFLGKPVNARDEFVTVLRNLHSLYKSGVLSESEFNSKKWEILSKSQL